MTGTGASGWFVYAGGVIIWWPGRCWMWCGLLAAWVWARLGVGLLFSAEGVAATGGWVSKIWLLEVSGWSLKDMMSIQVADLQKELTLQLHFFEVHIWMIKIFKRKAEIAKNKSLHVWEHLKTSVKGSGGLHRIEVWNYSGTQHKWPAFQHRPILWMFHTILMSKSSEGATGSHPVLRPKGAP